MPHGYGNKHKTLEHFLMIVSQDKKFVFLAIPKTASMSLHQHLYSQVEAEYNSPLLELCRAFDGHGTLREMKQLLPFSIEGFFSFAVVRNPFDRFISYCASLPEFELNPEQCIVKQLDEAQRYSNRFLWPQTFFTHDGDSFLLNQVLMFEHLADDFIFIAKRFGLDPNLPQLNGGTRKHYREYFRPETRLRIETIYAKDLVRFGYSF
jgi:hypothetical protein